MNISIITITFNNFQELLKTLRSTEGLPCERVVINGGSCSETKSYLESRPDIISLSEKDKGISDAFNKGIALSSKKGIWILNSGDTCNDRDFPQFADRNLNSYDFIYSPIILDDPKKGQHTLLPNPNLPLGLGMPYPHPGMILNRKIFNEVGTFDLSFKIAMDYELVCRMSIKNYKGLSYEQPTVVMDVFGISQERLWDGHIEAKRALKKNNIFKENRYFSAYRGFKILMKKGFYALGLKPLHEGIKKLSPSIWRNTD